MGPSGPGNFEAFVARACPRGVAYVECMSVLVGKDEGDPELVDYRGAARLTGLPVGTLYSLVSRLQIPHVRLGPRSVRFLRADLRRWIESRRVPVQHTYALRREAAAPKRRAAPVSREGNA